MFKAIRERRDRKVQEARGLAARGRHQKEREEQCKRAYRDKDALEGRGGEGGERKREQRKGGERERRGIKV